MSAASVTMMIITLGFYLGGFVFLVNRAFKKKNH